MHFLEGISPFHVPPFVVSEMHHQNLSPSHKQTTVSVGPSLHPLPCSAHTEWGCLCGKPWECRSCISCHQGLALYWWRLIRSLTITIQFDKNCAGTNQRMCGDKGQGHSPRLGGEPGNAQLPEKWTFKWITGGGGSVCVFVSISNCYYYCYFICIYFLNCHIFNNSVSMKGVIAVLCNENTMWCQVFMVATFSENKTKGVKFLIILHFISPHT